MLPCEVLSDGPRCSEGGDHQVRMGHPARRLGQFRNTLCRASFYSQGRATAIWVSKRTRTFLDCPSCGGKVWNSPPVICVRSCRDWQGALVMCLNPLTQSLAAVGCKTYISRAKCSGCSTAHRNVHRGFGTILPMQNGS